MPLAPPINKEYIERRIQFLKSYTKDLVLSVKELFTKENKEQSKENKEQIMERVTQNEEEIKFLRSFSEKFSGNEDKDEKVFSEFSMKDKDKLKSVFVEGMLEELAAITHGFVGADLNALAKEAAMAVLRKVLPKLKLKDEEQIPKEVLEGLRVAKRDFQDALRLVRPSAMREVLVETPNVKWEDVGGLDKVKQELKEAVEWPMRNPEAFTRMGIRPPRGVLMYGPPGTGKTLLAKAVAKESEANFIQVKGPSLLSMWVGKSEEGVRKIFERARQVSPCIIFFDEIDSLASRRGLEVSGSRVSEQVLNQLLAEMDGLEELQNVTVIGATNRPDMLDPAILRPGRFDRLVLVSPPTKEGRLEILKIHTKNMPLAKDVNIDHIAERTEGYVGADIESLTREAALLALREDMTSKEVGKKHFEEAMKKVKPSVSKDSMDKYRKMETDYLRSAKAALESVSYLG